MRPLFKTLITRLRLYRLAAGLYEAYRLLARPHTHGALVAIWWEERLLVVRSSYRTTWSLPGGGLKAGETPHQAAARELMEELGVVVEPDQLTDPWCLTESSNRGRNTVTFLRLDVAEPPAIVVDDLEIVGYEWLRPEAVRARPINSHLQIYLGRVAVVSAA